MELVVFPSCRLREEIKVYLDLLRFTFSSQYLLIAWWCNSIHIIDDKIQCDFIFQSLLIKISLVQTEISPRETVINLLCYSLTSIPIRTFREAVAISVAAVFPLRYTFIKCGSSFCNLNRDIFFPNVQIKTWMHSSRMRADQFSGHPPDFSTRGLYNVTCCLIPCSFFWGGGGWCYHFLSGSIFLEGLPPLWTEWLTHTLKTLPSLAVGNNCKKI